MLTKRSFVACCVGVAVTSALAPAGPAMAEEGEGRCPVTSPECDVTGSRPGGDPDTGGGSGGGRGGGGGGRSDPCTYQLADPQPPAGTGGHSAGGGAYYVKICPYGDGGSSTQLVWLATPPGNLGPSPQELARRAMAKIRLDGARIGIAPEPSGVGLVGLPVWLWTEVTPSTWGPISASASDGGLTVTITGRASQITWDMGDGSRVTCANPGTAYQASFGASPSPTCGYPGPGADGAPGYRRSSRDQPDGRYHVTASTSWRVEWSGGGQRGVINTTRTAETTIRVEELQVTTS